MGEAGLPHELPFPLTDTDRYVLSQTDEEYKYHDWAELKNIIGQYPLPEYSTYVPLKKAVETSGTEKVSGVKGGRTRL